MNRMERDVPSRATTHSLPGERGCDGEKMNWNGALSEESRQTSSVGIRTALVDDAARLAELSAQLGYPVAARDMQARLETVLRSEHDLVVVAQTQGGKIVGWLHATVSRTLVDEPASNIAGLIVDQQFRRAGVGRELMRQAEAWTLQQGLACVCLRSNIIRGEAHMFYERLGYKRVKTQHAYRKRLAP